MLVLSTPIFNFWQLLLVALLPYFLFVIETKRTRNLIIGTLLTTVPYCFAEGAPFFRLAGTWWTNGSTILGLPSMVAYPIGIFAIAVGAALFYVLPVLIHARVRGRIGKFSPLLFALLWSLTEYLRTETYFGGYTFGTAGYGLIETTYLKHIAAVASIFGLSFVAVLSCASLAALTHYVLAEKEKTLMRIRQQLSLSKWVAGETLIVMLFFVSVFLFGVVRELSGTPPVTPMRVAVIASTLQTEKSISAESYWLYHELMMRAITHTPNIIVLPENVFPYFIIDEQTNNIVEHPIIMLQNAHELLANFVLMTKQYPLVTFVVPTHTQNENSTYNSILLYKNGEVVGVYHKRYPVPFTEYAPFGLKLSLFEHIRKGEPEQTLIINGEKFDAAICSEIDYFSFPSNGTRFIISPSNDSALNGHEVILLHDRNARIRALESGAYMFRSTRGGISSVIDSYGRTIQAMQNVNDVIIVDVK